VEAVLRVAAGSSAPASGSDVGRSWIAILQSSRSFG
jgi:hypothetical protein